jgi:hypothetical protein
MRKERTSLIRELRLGAGEETGIILMLVQGYVVSSNDVNEGEW